MNDVLAESWGNPNSQHEIGEHARDILEQAREKMLRLLGAANGDRLIFTSGASESAALALKSMEDNCDIVGLCNVDHHCVTEYPLKPMGGEKPYRYGIAQMRWNNETGEQLILPYKGFTPIPKNSLWACDITAGVGHAPFTFKDYPKMSYAWGSAQKFGGICGVGFLLVKKKAPLSQMIYGAPERGGTPPVALIAAMAAALEWNVEHMEENAEHFNLLHTTMLTSLVRDVGYTFEQNIAESAISSGCYLPHILNISFDGVDGKTLALLLSKQGVMVSAGAACTSGNNEPSHVLMAMYGDEERARSAIRISFSHENTVEEVEQAAKKIAECVEFLRSIGA